MTTGKDIAIIPGIEGLILSLRGHQVMLDAVLAELYGVETRRLNEQVRRNMDRFPASFMFQLTYEETANLKSQIAISSLETGTESGWGGRRKLPLAFTEYGVLMLANVLKSGKAVDVSIQVIEAFVRLRAAILTTPDLAKRITAIEEKLTIVQGQVDVFEGIVLPLLTVHQLTRRKVGFNPGEDKR